MQVHLRRHFAEACDVLGPFELREAIEQGIASSARHRIETERGICKYLGLMFVFGRDFDRNQTWAARILAQAGSISEEEIMTQLSRAAASRADQGLGIRRLRGEVLP